MCVEGTFQLETNDEIYSYKTGDTLLIPANMTNFEIFGFATILEIYIS